jgi:hypothetical protein
MVVFKKIFTKLRRRESFEKQNVSLHNTNAINDRQFVKKKKKSEEYAIWIIVHKPLLKTVEKYNSETRE